MVSAGAYDNIADDAAVVDYKGSELWEKICVMGITMNLVTYLVGDLHLSTSRSANIVTDFMGTLNLLALFSAFLADAKLGRYKTVAIFATITATGVTLLTVATSLGSLRPPACDVARREQYQCVPASGSQLALLFTALYTTALGFGGIKANVSGFGSDQFDHRDAKEGKAMVLFFNRFYFCVSVGSLFAATVLVYVQDNVSRGMGYVVLAGTMVVAVVVLLLGRPKYRFRRPEGSPLTVIWRMLCLAWKKRSLPHADNPGQLNEYDIAKVPHKDSGMSIPILIFFAYSFSTQFFFTSCQRCLDKAALVECNPDREGGQSPLAAATVTQVEEVKMILKLLPIWSTCIPFWTVYSQMSTFSVWQATYMNRRIGSSFAFPAGSMCLFVIVTVLLFTSLNEKLVIQLARKFTANAQGITSLQRVAVGLAFSTLAMAVAASVERKRRDAAIGGNVGERIYVFWLVPQLFLLGAGEAFAYVGQLEFFIREAPERMKSMSTALFLTTLSIGSFFSSLLVFLVDKATNGGWIRNNLDAGRLDYFYWMIAAMSIVNFMVYLVFSSRHQCKLQSYELKSKDVARWSEGGGDSGEW